MHQHPQPAAKPSPSYGPQEPDGVTYGHVVAIHGLQLTYDKFDYLKAACDARTKAEDIVQESRAEAICFRNRNPLLRRVPLSATASVTGYSEGGEPRPMLGVQLARYLECCSGPDSWAITLRQGTIVRMDQLLVAGD